MVEHQPTAPFEAEAHERLGFHGVLHGELVEDLPAEAVDDHRGGVLLGQAALAAVEELVLADLGRRRLVLDLTRCRS
jgi:hypothetical protein